MLVSNLRQQWRIDSADFKKYKDENTRVQYLPVAVHYFSRKNGVQPLRDKMEVQVRSALAKVFTELRVPERIQCDKAYAVYTSTVQDFLKKGIVILFSPKNPRSSVQRLNDSFACYRTGYFAFFDIGCQHITLINCKMLCMRTFIQSIDTTAWS